MLCEIIWNERMLGVVLGCAIPITAVIGAFWYRIAKTTSENQLKRSMVERGMTADEIERVMSARSSRER